MGSYLVQLTAIRESPAWNEARDLIAKCDAATQHARECRAVLAAAVEHGEAPIDSENITVSILGWMDQWKTKGIKPLPFTVNSR